MQKPKRNELYLLTGDIYIRVITAIKLLPSEWFQHQFNSIKTVIVCDGAKTCSTMSIKLKDISHFNKNTLNR